MSYPRNTAIAAAMVILAVVMLVPVVTLTLLKDRLYYPSLTVDTASTAKTLFLLPGRQSLAACERTVARVSQGIVAACRLCRIEASQCLTTLSPEQRRILSPEPLGKPSSRLPQGGYIVYEATQPDVALQACKETERLSAGWPTGRLACFAPSAPRPFTSSKASITGPAYFTAFWFSVTSGIICWLVCLFLVRYQRFHGHLTHDAVSGGPQKFHAVATPRIGGVAILIGLLFTAAGLVPVEHRFSVEEYGYFILAALPAFAVGFAEDVTKKVGVLPRLAGTMVAAALCAWLLGAVLRRLDVPLLDVVLVSTPIAVAFTVFAVGGVANAINIIDGYNGLVGGYSVIVLAAIAWVAAQVGDMFILTAALSMGGALLGFLAWNYPRGRIFLGDGGAYFLGFWLAELSVLLVTRHESVSPWFPLVLLLYPVFETLFTIYRRRILRGRHPGHPDALHMHQMIYLRLTRKRYGHRDAASITRRNSHVVLFILPVVALLGVAAAVWHDESTIQMGFSVAFCVAYVWLYRRLVYWKAPGWLVGKRLRQ